MAVGNWGMAPSEYWALSPFEFWLIYEAKLPPKKLGNMLESDAERLTKMMDEAGWNDG